MVLASPALCPTMLDSPHDSPFTTVARRVQIPISGVDANPGGKTPLTRYCRTMPNKMTTESDPAIAAAPAIRTDHSG